MFTRTVATTEEISILTGKYKTKPLFEVYTTIPLRIQRPTFITPLRDIKFSSIAAPLMTVNNRALLSERLNKYGKLVD